jgi:enterobactin synthetase component D / holo-[acyl-carrier protein] synthase
MHRAVAADIAFDLRLKHGVCVGVRMPTEDPAVRTLARSVLLPDEVAHAEGLTPIVRRSWVGGRVALREALGRLGVDAPPVLRGDRGAPVLPAGTAASVSHKEGLAAALAVLENSAQVGVDLEFDVARGHDIARRVLTADELEEIASWAPADRDREVLLRFSAKEAIYKAIDPFVRRYVGFQEVAVRPLPEGGAAVRAVLKGGEGPFAIDVTWRRFDGVVLTTARVSR